MKYLFGKTNGTAYEENLLSDVDLLDFDLISSGVGVISAFETFNNVLSPTKGIPLHLSYVRYLEFLGRNKDN